MTAYHIGRERSGGARLDVGGRPDPWAGLANVPLHGFSLVELLVVNAIIGVPAALTLSAVTSANAKARSAAYISNFRQFGIALQLYGSDFQDHFPPNGDGRSNEVGASWVNGWLGTGGPDLTNIVLLEWSLLAPYLGNPTVWRCPAAQPVNIPGQHRERVRNLALNCFIGTPEESPAATTYRTFASAIRPGPAATITFFDERVDTITDGSFALQWDFVRNLPDLWVLRDKTTAVHSDGGQVAFVDGHLEHRRWKDPRVRFGARDDANVPRSEGVLWMQEHSTER